jgi:preprotein translocase subunit SecY
MSGIEIYMLVAPLILVAGSYFVFWLSHKKNR